ncbi:MAG: HD domain-containing protein [Nanoarchaeota archaeon]
MAERVNQLIDFLKEIEQFKSVQRVNVISKELRRESDAEHTWHLAMFFLLFEKELPVGIDLVKVLKLCLIHDLPEIYAGDTFAFDTIAVKTKKEREDKAASKLFSNLPDDLRTDFMALWKEYESCVTKEAQFVKSFDKMQPILQHLCTEGRVWKERGIKYEQVDGNKRNHMTHHSLTMDIYERLMEEAKERRLL